MNMQHFESADAMVAYHRQRIAEEFAAIQRSTFWQDARIQVAHMLMRAGEALDRGCQEHRVASQQGAVGALRGHHA